MELNSGALALPEPPPVVELHVDADELTMDAERQDVQLVDESAHDWSHISQTPMQVVRVLSADGEVLQVLSSEYHNMDGHAVTIVPDDTGGHYAYHRDALGVELSVSAAEEEQQEREPEHHPQQQPEVDEPSLTLQLDIPFMTEENQNDPEVQFFADIYRYLVAGVTADSSEANVKSLKKKVKEYSVVDGELYYGSRNPRQIVLDKERQRQIIARVHVEPQTGIHLGVKRMYAAIQHYWRGVYNDLTQHVRMCGACFEEERLSRPPGLQITSLPDQRAAAERSERSERSERAERLQQASSEVTKAQVRTDRATRVWKKVEACVYGPYPETECGNQYLLGLVDPVSRWIEALPVPESGNCVRLADFIFRAFCTLGFAQCALVGVTEQQFEEMQDRYKGRFEQIQQIFEKLEQPSSEQSFVFTLQESSSDCTWATEMLDSFVEKHMERWDSQLDAFLFGYHATPRPDYGGFSPFYVMYGRNSSGAISEEDKENCTILEEEMALEPPVRPRRRLQSSTLQCRHCSEIFTSKISFRIHQRRHTEEAKKLGVRDGEEPLRPVAIERKLLKRAVRRKQRRPARPQNRVSHRQPRPGWIDESLQVESPAERQALTTNTVSAVKQLIEATREERSRRGKYIKYSEELKDEIAEYALRRSHTEAAEYYSQCLGGTVSQSSIRNFIKAYRIFSPEVKDEIGRFGLEFGAEEATIHFSAKLSRDLKVGVVKKYMKMARDKVAAAGGDNGTGANAASELVISKSEEDGGTRRKLKHTFTDQLKEEIGRYSLQYGLQETIQHYSEKLQFAMKESTVRKFRKMVMENNSKAEAEQQSALAATASQQQTYTEQPHQAQQQLEQQLQLPQQVSVIGQPVSVASAGYVYNTYTIPASQAAGGQATAFYQQPASHLPPSSTIIVNPYQPAGQAGYQAFCATGQAQPSAYLGNAMLPVIQQAPPASVQQQYIPQMLEHLDMRQETVFAAGGTRQDPLELATSEANIPGAYGVVTSAAHAQQQSVPLHQVAVQQSPQQPEQAMDQSDMPPPSAAAAPAQKSEQQQSPAMVAPSPAASEATRYKADSFEVDEDDPTEDDEPVKPRRRRRVKHPKPIEGSASSAEKKRGFYASYSPEIRAEIGKYAYMHGNQAATVHFREKLGCHLPESTIRGLKEKYIVKLRKSDTDEVTALGFAQRGRPIRLGKYDGLVQDCIRELVSQGEKVSSFLCIATAKQVLMQYEPDLLDERGGPIKLNPTWAKSFLKRLGLNQNNS